MARVEPLERPDLSELKPLLDAVEHSVGFVPNSMLTMARWPVLVRGFAALAKPILEPGRLSRELKQLVALVSSAAAGCRYCQAHTSHSAAHAGAAAEKIQAIWEFEPSPLFSPREKAALRLAKDAGVTPNQVEEEHFKELRRYFDDDEIVEIVAVISLFGFLNRWNDTLATSLENGPRSYAEDTLASAGWSVGKHR